MNRSAPPRSHTWTSRASRTILPVLVVLGALVAAPGEARKLLNIDDITVRQLDSGATEVKISADGTMRRADCQVYEFQQGLPRAVLRIDGIRRSTLPDVIAVGDTNLQRVRVGQDPDSDPPRLSLVFELQSHAVRLQSFSVEGTTLQVLFTGGPPATPTPRPTTATPGASSQPRPSSSAVTPSPNASPAPAPTPIPTVISTPTVAPPPPSTPTATPTPTPRQFPTATPPPPPSPSPRAAAPPRATSSATQPELLYRSAATGQASTPDNGPLAHVHEIVSSQRPSGETLLRVSLDRDVGARRIRHRRNPADPFELQFVLQAVDLGQLPPVLVAADSNLRQLELQQLDGDPYPELELTLQLSSKAVDVGDVALRGPHLVIVLSPPASP